MITVQTAHSLVKQIIHCFHQNICWPQFTWFKHYSPWSRTAVFFHHQRVFCTWSENKIKSNIRTNT